MPPSNKRSRDESSDSEQRLTKGSKLGSAFSLPSHNVPTETTSPDAPERLLTAAVSVATANRSARAQPASQNRREREYLYRDKLAQLNHNAKNFATAKLQNDNDISNEGFYYDFAYKYLSEAEKLKRLFNRSHGDVAVCGSGEMGQLGVGESILESRRFKVVANLRNQNIHQIAAGGMHCVALNEDGNVYTWGCSDEGSLGVLDPAEDGFLPNLVTGFYPSQYGPNGTAGLLDSFGNVLPFEQRPEANILQVAAGSTQSLALSSTGDVYSFGSIRDNEGQNFREQPPEDDTRDQISPADMNKVANGEEQMKYLKVPRGKNNHPVHLTGFTQKVIQLSAGENANAAILADNTTVVTWGIDLQGEMARPVCKVTKKTDHALLLREHLTPHPALWAGPPIQRTVLQVSCGGWHLLAVTRENNHGLSVYSSGLNNHGQLGHGMCQGENGMEEDIKSRDKLTKIEFFEGKDIEIVEGGYHNSFFVGGRGYKLYSAGRGDYGALGITYNRGDSGFFMSTPARVPLVYDVRSQGNISEPTRNCIVEETIDEDEQPEIEQIAAGGSHVMVVTKQGDVYSWGFGESGACGQNKAGSSEEEADITLPQKMNLMTKKKMKMQIKYVSSGAQHSAVILSTSDSFGEKF